MASKLTLETLCNDVQLCIIEAIDSPQSLINYLKASPIAAAVFAEKRRSILLNFIKKNNTADGVAAALKKRHRDSNPNTTNAEVQIISVRSLDYNSFDNETLRYLLERCAYLEPLVDRGMELHWFEKKPTWPVLGWKLPDEPGFSWESVLVDLRARLYSGFLNMQLYYGLVDLGTVDAHGDIDAEWADMTELDTHPGRQCDALIDMFLVAKVLEHEFMRVDNALRNMFTWDYAGGMMATLGPRGRRLLPHKQAAFFKDITRFVEDNRRNKDHDLNVWKEIHIGYHRNWDQSEYYQLRIFSLVFADWASYVGWILLDRGLNDPPVFVPPRQSLYSRYREAVTRADNWSSWQLAKREKIAARKLAKVAKTTRHIANDATEVLLQTKHIRILMFKT